jgi:hypothetical protein
VGPETALVPQRPSSSRRRAGSRGPARESLDGSRAKVPPQGYETDEETLAGKAVEPPTAIEIVGSLVELAVEGSLDLARAGATAGRDLLRSATHRLGRS